MFPPSKAQKFSEAKMYIMKVSSRKFSCWVYFVGIVKLCNLFVCFNLEVDFTDTKL